MPDYLEPYFCKRCSHKLGPSDIVVQGVQTIDATLDGEVKDTAGGTDRHRP